MPEAQNKVSLKDEILTDNERDQKIEELKKMVNDCSSLNIRNDDMLYLRFLNCNDWNVIDAFEHMKKYFKFRRENPKWFFNTSLKDFDYVLRNYVKAGLPQRDKKGRRIYLTRPGNVKNLEVYDMAQLDDLWFEFFLSEPETIKNGVCVLIDGNGFNWKLLKFFAPSNVKVGSQKTELLPLKNIEFHVVNTSAVINAATQLLYPFLNKDIKNKIFFHYNNYETLHAHLGRECLPAEYGGEGGKIDFDDLYGVLFKNSKRYDTLMHYGWISNSEKIN
jgi:hypothetical protein